mmetsp:Transcript_13075/g.26537  ORF Transcript_13075/g.26537 Transcript_13075/m.26537 type:complete len:223 (+) Transcript_13075:370-1038(+)
MSNWRVLIDVKDLRRIEDPGDCLMISVLLFLRESSRANSLGRDPRSSGSVSSHRSSAGAENFLFMEGPFFASLSSFWIHFETCNFRSLSGPDESPVISMLFRRFDGSFRFMGHRASVSEAELKLLPFSFPRCETRALGDFKLSCSTISTVVVSSSGSRNLVSSWTTSWSDPNMSARLRLPSFRSHKLSPFCLCSSSLRIPITQRQGFYPPTHTGLANPSNTN